MTSLLCCPQADDPLGVKNSENKGGGRVSPVAEKASGSEQTSAQVSTGVAEPQRRNIPPRQAQTTGTGGSLGKTCIPDTRAREIGRQGTKDWDILDV